MNKTEAKIKNFTDLKAWQEAHKLAVSVYKITSGFPQSEQFGLTSQIRRASVSISSNIAEGFSRITKADKAHFYSMAKGSTTEVQNQLLLARDIKYLKNSDFQKVAEQSTIVSRLLTGLSRSLNNGNGVKK